MRELTDADLAQHEARAKITLASTAWANEAELARVVLDMAGELRWWREQYGTHPVPYALTADHG